MYENPFLKAEQHTNAHFSPGFSSIQELSKTARIL